MFKKPVLPQLKTQTWCAEHDCPRVSVNGHLECVVERLGDHLSGQRVTDLIERPSLTLVFTRGHMLPLLCPDCGGPTGVHADWSDAFLDQLGRLYVVGVAYVQRDGRGECMLALADDPTVNPNDLGARILELRVHIESARRLTCPTEEVLQ